MPNREYRCPRCGCVRQVLEGWELASRVCPRCGWTMRLVIGAPAVRFGTTWVRHSLFDDGDRGHGGDLGLYGG